ncbi:DUF3493 domain-containing protein [Gloeobacter violaceus]|uniref:Gsr3796 protein n=1 Tax=Gloeobacter violaceus (strain ATCC 29082 / PCC 7421) TaxID=251221 RepID=Q7NET2_GLOVI|nr:DUF3493 domain-containing protein [Gloeobacter violaceus]BAC91737.1 gsr3796 [Gloeobacter violaceus PCC 7421]
MNAEEIARRRASLRVESRHPWRKLRLGLYLAFGASGVVGFFVAFFRVLAGRELPVSLTNLAVQSGVIALMVFLWRLETRKENALFERYLAQETRRPGA